MLIRSHFFLSILTALFLIVAACSEPSGDEKKATAAPAPTVPDGLAVFRKYCVNCHGADGRLGLSGAKVIPDSKLTQAEREILIKKGRNLMTPFETLLTDAEIKAVAEFTFSLK